MERIANASTTTLNGAINNAVTTLVVSSPSSFPALPNFTIAVIGASATEYMHVTGVSSDTFTVTRAYDGSAAISHLNLEEVKLIQTAKSFNDMVDERVGVGAIGDYSATTNQSRLWLGNDAPYLVINRSHSLFAPLIPIREWNVSDYTWFNQGSSTLTQKGPFAAEAVIQHTTNDSLRGVEKAYTGSKTMEAWFDLMHLTAAFQFGCIVFGNAIDNKKLALVCVSRSASLQNISALYYTGFTVITTTHIATNAVWRFPIGLRGTDDGVNTITWQICQDGYTWQTLTTVNYAALFTPTRAGIAFENNSTIAGTPSARIWVSNARMF